MAVKKLFLHETFMEVLQTYVFEQSDRHIKGEIEWVPYGKEITICPEPITFLSKLDDYSNNQKECLVEFRKLAASFQRVKIEKRPNAFWFNTTKKGINLRPGMNPQDEPAPVQMGDTAVHGLMAGQTGSGKSVLLNNLIFNLLAEYPPWELDLYLADFKKVEFSRYMNKFETPHISACAATSEIRYVISMIRYMVECMNARERLFARLGFQKLSDLRDSRELEEFAPIVLPRMLLIVDEFQQMFLDASPKEGEQIRDMLTAIVKKGRATGLHILFASQEMSNTLSRSDLANFKIRFALNCNVGVSMDVIGNNGATRIQKGTVIYNTSDGTAETNVLYKVPYVETEVSDGNEYSYFEEFLAYMVQFRQMFSFKKAQKFYQEELQSPFSRKDRQVIRDNPDPGKFDCFLTKKIPISLEEILEQIRGHRKEALSDNSNYFEVFTLGDYVTFSNLRYDIQTLFLEYGRSKNILAVSPRIEDLAYLEKLFSYNFMTSPRSEITGVDYRHIIYSFQASIRGLFSLEKATGQEKVITNPDELEGLRYPVEKRRMIYHLCQEYHTPYEFAIANFRANLADAGRSYSVAQAAEMEENAVVFFRKVFGEISLEDLPGVCRRIQEDEELGEVEKVTAANLMTMYTYQKNPVQAFPPTVIWLIGIDSVERIPEWLFTIMKNALELNLLFIVMANSEFDQIRQMAKCCDYLFAGGNQSVIYDRLQMQYTKKEADSIALDLNIRSMEENRSFKKYKCSFGKMKAPSVPFDDILSWQS